ncbi:MAG: DUF1987 domain-containing protein [Bacteroidales bacterium]|nr:DUF1987 domain-containing protein [Bacteroidales bacterium]
MNQRLKMNPKIDIPKVDFSAESGELHIEGKSFPPDVTSVFNNVLNWLDEYALSPAKKTTLTLKLDYFNTASSKIIMDILYKMEELHNNGNETLVKWFYPEDDEDMMETGKEYAEIIKVPFEHIGYTFMID